MGEWKETEFGKIPVEWEVSTLGEICEILTDGSHFSPKPQYSNFYMASVKDMRYDYFDLSDCKTISEEDFNNLVNNNCSPKFGDILISKDGANCLDLIFVYKQPMKIVLLSSIAIARLKPSYDPNFYRYFLLSSEVQSLMRNNYVSGSAIPRVVLKDFRNIPVPIIELNKQKTISDILSTLDSKINLLHHQNTTLEKMAETIYRQWFIEEAKEDWKDGTLGDIIDLNYGKSLKEELRTGKGYPVVGSSGIVGYHSEYLVEGPGIVIGRKGTLGVVVYLKDNFFPIDTTYYVTPKESSLLPYYNYCLLKSINFEELNSDSAVPGLNRNIALAWEIKIPPINKIIEFNNWSLDFFKKIESNQEQIQILTQLRDTLLPKLMSGEIKVTD